MAIVVSYDKHRQQRKENFVIGLFINQIKQLQTVEKRSTGIPYVFGSHTVLILE